MNTLDTLNKPASDKVYLPGLNGVRAVAAIVVFIAHFDVYFTQRVNLDCFTIYHTNYQAALAVTLFFVLSGYLITFLLIKEKDKFKTINLRLFYIRRILRIWPLYYLILLSTFFLNAIFFHYQIFGSDTEVSVFLYTIFAGNFVESFFVQNAKYYLAPLLVLWSVGVEEQFYLFWPLLINSFRRIKITLIIFLIAFLILKLLVRVYLSDNWVSFIGLTRLDCMAIGGIGACVWNVPKYQSLIYNKYIQLVSYIVFVSAFTRPIHISSLFDMDFYAVFFIIIIINLSTNTKVLVSFENKLFNFFGRISYSFYMYHTLVLYTFTMSIKPWPNSMFVYFASFVLMLACTVAISYLSNRYFESYFLRKKKSFTKIASTS